MKLKTLTAALSVVLSITAAGCSRDGSQAVSTADVMVIGGGTSGTIAAIQAAKAGCRTILVESGSQLGGTMTTGGVAIPGLFHAWGKQIIGGIGWELVERTVALNNDKLPDFTIPCGHAHWKHQISINRHLYALLAEQACLESGAVVRYYETPICVTPADDGWLVRLVGKGMDETIRTRQLIDCTGNAAAVRMAGFECLREDETQPGSLIFELEGYDFAALDKEAISACYDKALAAGTLLKTDAYNGIEALLTVGNGLATQHVPGADSSTSLTHTRTNIEGRASLLRILRFVRTLPGCEKVRIKSMSPETAVRETYRIDGLYRITRDDYVSGRHFEDALCYSFYPIDLHVSHGVEPRHLRDSVVATIPLRAMIPRGSRNLTVAGRSVSSDRLANSALRVQASCMAMGQAAGAVAAIACKENTTPEKVSLDKVRNLLAAHGAILPD